MIYSLLADGVLVLHLCFILFAVLGGLLVLRWRRSAWVHVPAVAWAALVEFAGWVCPLTPLEHWLRRRTGLSGASGGFIEHYLLPVIYPAGMSRNIQIMLGALVLGINVALYGWVWRGRFLGRTPPGYGAGLKSGRR
ncbi:MAG: DUF2784 domain-containing protein [Acidobacteriota bacterium]